MSTFNDLLLILRGDTTDIDKKLRATQTELRTFATTSNTLGASLTSLGTRLSAAITLPMVGVAAASLKLSGELEQNKIAFTTMLGSVDAAQQHLDKLRAFAQATPFQFTDVVLASKRLQALGFSAEQIIPTLTSVGNAAAALGTGSVGIERITTALGQMLSKGKVQSEEMRQLAEAGIPAWQILANVLGVDVATAMKKVEDGAVSSGKAVPALLAGINERFGGLMEAQSKTLLGRFSNFKDLLDKTLTDIGEKLKPLASDLLDFGTKALAQVQAMAAGFAKLPRPVQDTAAAVAVLAAVSGVAIFAIGQIASSVGAIANAVKVALPFIIRLGSLFSGMSLGVAGAALGAGAAVLYLGNKMLEVSHAADQTAETNKKLTDAFNKHAGVVTDLTSIYGRFDQGLSSGTIAKIAGFKKALDPVSLEEFQKALEKLGIKGTSAQIKELTDAFETVRRSGKLGAGELADAYNELQIKIAKLKSELKDNALNTLGVAPDSGLQEQAIALAVVQKQFLSGKASLREYIEAQQAYTAASSKTNDVLPLLSAGLERLDHIYRNSGVAAGMLSAELSAISVEVQNSLLDLFSEELKKAEEHMGGLGINTLSTDANLKLLGKTTGQEVTDKVKLLTAALIQLQANAKVDPNSVKPAIAVFNDLQGVLAEIADSPAFTNLGLHSQASLKILAETAKANFESIKQDATSSTFDIGRAWLKMVDAQVAAGAILDEATRKQYARITAAVDTSVKDQTKFWTTLGKQVSTIMTDLSRGIAEAIVNFKGFGALGVKVIQDISQAVIRLLIETSFKKLLDTLAGVQGMIGSIAKALGGVASNAKTAADAIAKIATPPFSTNSKIPGIGGAEGAGSAASGGGGGGGAAGAASAAAGGVMGMVGAVGAVVSAVGSIGTWIESIRQEGTQNAMEQELKVIAMSLSGIARPWDTADPNADTLMANIKGLRFDFHNYYTGAFSGWYRTLMDQITLSVEGIDSVLRQGGGASGKTTIINATINVEGSDDPRATAKQIIDELKRLDPSFA